MKRLPKTGLCLAAFLLLPGCDDGITEEEDPGPDTLTGGQVWLARFAGDDTEEMEDVLVTSDGAYLVTGTTLSAGAGDGDVWLLKVDSVGAVVWQKTYGGPQLDIGYDAVETADGGFVVAAATASYSNGGTDMWVIRTDAAGAVQWQKSYGGAGVEQAWSVDLTGDGGYVVTGGTTSFGAGGSDVLVVKLDASGEIVWQKAFGGALDDAPGGEYEEHLARVMTDGSGDHVVSTVTYSFGSGDSDVWVFKLDPAGTIQWQYAYGDEDEDGMWSAAVSSDGSGYVVSGYFTPLSDYDTDLWTYRLNTDGTIAWQNSYGLSGIYDEALAVGAMADGGALMGGSSYTDGDTDWDWTVTRVDADGNLLWGRRYERGFDWPNAMAEQADGRLLIAGVTMTSLSDQEDLWLMKTASDGTIGSACAAVDDAAPAEEATAIAPVATSATVTDTDMVAQATTGAVADTDFEPTFDCTA